MTSLNYMNLEAFEPDKAGLLSADVLSELAKQSLGELNLEKTLLGVITHAFPDTQLPVKLDVLFEKQDVANHLVTRMTIRGCFNYGKKFHTQLWKGHSHLAIIEFEDGLPEIIQSLKSWKTRKRWDLNLILCRLSEMDACQQHIRESTEQFEAFMKEKNPHIWESNRLEEEEFRKKEASQGNNG